MPNTRKTAPGEKRVNKTATASKPAAEPLLGEAALKQAMAEIAANPTAAGAFGAAQAGASAPGRAASEPPPKTVSQVLGEITWLMTQSPRHKSIPLGDLEWLVMPAVLLKQFRMFYKGEQPAGVAVWALVDDLVAKRIDAGEKRLAAVEWKSGTNMRILDVVAPFGAEGEMREQVILMLGAT
jgi:cytolysin-activating lysine-acyltransferase